MVYVQKPDHARCRSLSDWEEQARRLGLREFTALDVGVWIRIDRSGSNPAIIQIRAPCLMHAGHELSAVGEAPEPIVLSTTSVLMMLSNLRSASQLRRTLHTDPSMLGHPARPPSIVSEIPAFLGWISSAPVCQADHVLVKNFVIEWVIDTDA